MSINIEALDLSQYNPEMTMIIVNVYIGKMPPSKVKAHLERYKEHLAPFFKERGFEVVFVPVSFDMAQSGFKGMLQPWNELPQLDDPDLAYCAKKMIKGTRQVEMAKAANDDKVDSTAESMAAQANHQFDEASKIFTNED